MYNGPSQDLCSFTISNFSESSVSQEFQRQKSIPKLCFLHMPGPEEESLGFEAIERAVRDLCARLTVVPVFIPHPSKAVTPDALIERTREVTLKKTTLELSFCQAACINLTPSHSCADLPFILGFLKGKGKPVVGFSLDPSREANVYDCMLECIYKLCAKPEPVAELDTYTSLLERAICRAALALD